MTRRLRILFLGATWQGSSPRALCRALAEREDTEVLEQDEDHFNPLWTSVPLSVLNRAIPYGLHSIENWIHDDYKQRLLDLSGSDLMCVAKPKG